MDNKVSGFNQIKEQISRSRKFRKSLCFKSHRWFFATYFSEFVQYPTADFQAEMFNISEDRNTELAVIVAFRGSGKSTIMSHSYPIWAILGELQKTYVIVISQTRSQAGQILVNIKRELESNELLVADYGPFKDESDVWRSDTLIIPDFDARITSLSVGENIRGLRHKSTRPDLIICDDVESLDSVKTKDGRNNIYRWFTGDVVPAGDLDTKVIVIGNLLHEDSLIMRLKESIEEGTLDGVFCEYPLVTPQGKILWSGKFTDAGMIKKLKATQGDEIAWQREYLLRIVPDQDRVIYKDWIKYYAVLPKPSSKDFLFSVTGVDLAISEKSSADYTSAVSAYVFGDYDEWLAYILPQPINMRLNFPKTVSTMKNIMASFGHDHYLCIENVAYQKALLDQLEDEGLPVIGIKVGKQDKRSRLSITAPAIKSGKVLFPQRGCKDLINQLTNFGIEKYDDLADAFSILMSRIFEECNAPRPQLFVAYGSDDYGASRDEIF